MRVVLATDQPALTNKLLVTPDANAQVDLNKIAGTATATGNGVVGAGVQRVAIASDNSNLPVTVGKKATLWQTGGPTSRSTGLTTELNSLANGAYSSAGTAFDNTTNRDQYGALDIVLASLTPASGASLSVYLLQSLDGTTYEDAPASTNPGTHMLVATVLLNASTSAKRVMSPAFYLPPGKFKLVLLNSAGVALASSGNTVTLYTSNDEAQ